MGDFVTNVADAVHELHAHLGELIAAADDPHAEGLCTMLLDIGEATNRLRDAQALIEQATAKAMMDDQLVVDGRLRAERKRARDRKEWRHDDWKHDVREKALRRHNLLNVTQVVTADGEVRDVDLFGLLDTAQGVHGSTAPKVTGLRELGLDAGDYCRTEPGRVTVTVTRLADTDDGGE